MSEIPSSSVAVFMQEIYQMAARRRTRRHEHFDKHRYGDGIILQERRDAGGRDDGHFRVSGVIRSCPARPHAFHLGRATGSLALRRRHPMASATLVYRLRAAFLVGLMALGLAGCGYNEIPTLQEQAKARWSEVQNQYQRRADLIPNLVATVQGYAKQEKDVLTAVVEARAKATQVKVDGSQLGDQKLKQFIDAQNQFSGAIGRLLAVSEAYPDLKSNANFSPCNPSWKARRTALRLRGATTSTPCAPTISASGPSRPCSGPRRSFPVRSPWPSSARPTTHRSHLK